MVTGRCPARSQRSAAVRRLRSNSTPESIDERRSSLSTRSEIIPAARVRLETGSMMMKAPVPRFFRYASKKSGWCVSIETTPISFNSSFCAWIFDKVVDIYAMPKLRDICADLLAKCASPGKAGQVPAPRWPSTRLLLRTVATRAASATGARACRRG